uniref:NADPH oxidase 1 n=1 Tax=Lygus hesperus TaxID=30085 RepID=A0A0A9YDQ0_LYGHE
MDDTSTNGAGSSGETAAVETASNCNAGNAIPNEEWIDMGDTWISVNGPLGTPTTVVQSILKNHVPCSNLALICAGIGVTPFVSALEYTAHNFRILPTKSVDENYYVRRNMFLNQLMSYQQEAERVRCTTASLRTSTNRFRNRLSSMLQSAVHNFTNTLRRVSAVSRKSSGGDTACGETATLQKLLQSVERTTMLCLGDPMELATNGTSTTDVHTTAPTMQSIRSAMGTGGTVEQFLQPFNLSLHSTK